MIRSASVFSNPNLKIILQTDFISLMILSRLPCMIGQPCACSCVRSSPGPGDLPSLLGGRWRRGHWKNPEEDFHMSLEGGIGGGCRFLEETGREMQLGYQTMLESTNISSASPGLFNLRAKLSSDIYGAVPSTLSDPQLSRSNRIEHVHKRHKGNWSNVSEAVPSMKVCTIGGNLGLFFILNDLRI